jgi:hypothetical protein
MNRTSLHSDIPNSNPSASTRIHTGTGGDTLRPHDNAHSTGARTRQAALAMQLQSSNLSSDNLLARIVPELDDAGFAYLEKHMVEIAKRRPVLGSDIGAWINWYERKLKNKQYNYASFYPPTDFKTRSVDAVDQELFDSLLGTLPVSTRSDQPLPKSARVQNTLVPRENEDGTMHRPANRGQFRRENTNEVGSQANPSRSPHYPEIHLVPPRHATGIVRPSEETFSDMVLKTRAKLTPAHPVPQSTEGVDFTRKISNQASAGIVSAESGENKRRQSATRSPGGNGSAETGGKENKHEGQRDRIPSLDTSTRSDNTSGDRKVGARKHRLALGLRGGVDCKRAHNT